MRIALLSLLLLPYALALSMPEPVHEMVQYEKNALSNTYQRNVHVLDQRTNVWRTEMDSPPSLQSTAQGAPELPWMSLLHPSSSPQPEGTFVANMPHDRPAMFSNDSSPLYIDLYGDAWNVPRIHRAAVGLIAVEFPLSVDVFTPRKTLDAYRMRIHLDAQVYTEVAFFTSPNRLDVGWTFARFSGSDGEQSPAMMAPREILEFDHVNPPYTRTARARYVLDLDTLEHQLFTRVEYDERGAVPRSEWKRWEPVVHESSSAPVSADDETPFHWTRNHVLASHDAPPASEWLGVSLHGRHVAADSIAITQYPKNYRVDPDTFEIVGICHPLSTDDGMCLEGQDVKSVLCVEEGGDFPMPTRSLHASRWSPQKGMPEGVALSTKNHLAFLEGRQSTSMPLWHIPDEFTLCALVRSASPLEKEGKILTADVGVRRRRVFDTEPIRPELARMDSSGNTRGWSIGYAWDGEKSEMQIFHGELRYTDAHHSASRDSTEWVAVCTSSKSNGGVAIDGQRYLSTGTDAFGNATLVINGDPDAAVDWAVADILVWDRFLPEEDMAFASRILSQSVLDPAFDASMIGNCTDDRYALPRLCTPSYRREVECTSRSITCPPGAQPNAERVSCEKCPPGTASATYTTKPCQTCLAGYYAEDTGNIRCSPCPIHTFSPVKGSTSGRDCIPCQEHTYTRGEGTASGTECRPCAGHGI